MDWRTANQAAAVAVPFLVDGEYVIPDAGSVTLTIRGNDAGVLTGYDNLVQPDPTISTMVLSINSTVNQIDSASAMETRYVSVSYQVGNVPYTYQYNYRLTPFLPIQKTAEDVRSLIGVDYKALPDSDVDLYESYYKLKDDIGADFVTALVSTTRAAIVANNMIALQAAILLVPSLQTRVMKSETSHNEIYERNKIDFEVLKADLLQRLEDEEKALEDIVNGVTILTGNTVFFLTSPVDVITGA